MFKSLTAFLILPILAMASTINLTEARKAVVYIAVESSPFDRFYGPDSSCCEAFKSFHNFFWPPELARGSGFIISPEGHVITNDHVVEDSTNILVIIRDPDLKLCKATVLGKDPRCDIAVLKLELEEGESLPYLTLGDSDLVELGDPVFRIGNPRGFDSSISTGIVSEKNRNFVGWQPIEGYLQTDAPCNYGNSGGPVLNSQGEVIGVSCLSARGEGLNFEIPSNIAKAIADQIIANGKITQGFLGIRLEDNTLIAFDYFSFDRHEGARIESIIQASPAEKAGLEVGDLIVELNDKPIQSSADLRNKIAVLPEETTVFLKVYRNEELLEFNLTLGSDKLSKRYSRLQGSSIII